jgi:hypothetical protein
MVDYDSPCFRSAYHGVFHLIEVKGNGQGKNDPWKSSKHAIALQLKVDGNEK